MKCEEKKTQYLIIKVLKLTQPDLVIYLNLGV